MWSFKVLNVWEREKDCRKWMLSSLTPSPRDAWSDPDYKQNQLFPEKRLYCLKKKKKLEKGISCFVPLSNGIKMYVECLKA